MLYNRILNKIITNVDCMNCGDFDKATKRCSGFGKTCFEFDPKSKTCIDPVTKLPIRLQKEDS